MKHTLKWKQDFFSSNLKIISSGMISKLPQDIVIGEINDKFLSTKTTGFFNNKEFYLKTKGVFHPITSIYDSSDDSLLAQISYVAWMNKAKITIDDKIYDWKYDNMWNTKWRIFDSYGDKINYMVKNTNGKIEYDNIDDVLIIAGLYVHKFYMSMLMLIITITIIISTNSLLISPH